MFKFEKMIAWQKGVDFADKAFDIADRLPQRLQYSISDQLRRAALSVTNNLAEGSGRRSPGNRRNFYDIAKGSVYEVVSVLAIALRRKQITRAEFDQFYRLGDELASIISGLIDATFREEDTRTNSSHTLREDSADYAVVDLSHSNSKASL